VSVSLNYVGLVDMARGKHGEARKNFEESLRILTNLQRDGKLFPQWRSDITSIAYLKDLAAWNALPFWKHLRTKKPQPPEGI
jgi:hypothetical protein